MELYQHILSYEIHSRFVCSSTLFIFITFSISECEYILLMGIWVVFSILVYYNTAMNIVMHILDARVHLFLLCSHL